MIGSVTYTVAASAPQKLYTQIKLKKLTVCNICEKENHIDMTVSFTDKRRFEKICSELNCDYEETGRGGVCRLWTSMKKRMGLLVAGILFAVFLFVIRNFTVSIEVLTDDEVIRQRVLTVLYDNGVKAGTYIPDINCVEIERALKQEVEGISWAGISLTDSTIIVDVIETIPTPEKHSERMPSNLIASHSGVIEEVELYNGELVKTINSGVIKGEVIVSGTIKKERMVVEDDKLVPEEYEKYVRSIGKIYGTYYETITFEQPLKETCIINGEDTKQQKYISVFSCDIPLFFKKVSGYYSENEDYSPLKIFGLDTPVGIKTRSYTEYGFETKVYTKKQAKKLADEKRKLYEKNFLGECEIKKRDKNVKFKDGKAILTVKYEIYGLMSEESQFFIKK